MIKKICVLILIALSAIVFAQDTARKDMAQIIKNYDSEKPEIMLEALQKFENTAPEDLKENLYWNLAFSAMKAKKWEKAAEYWGLYQLVLTDFNSSDALIAEFEKANSFYAAYNEYQDPQKIELLVKAAEGYSNYLKRLTEQPDQKQKIRAAKTREKLDEIADIMKKISDQLKQNNDQNKLYRQFKQSLSAANRKMGEAGIQRDETQRINDLNKAGKNMFYALEALQEAPQAILQHVDQEKVKDMKPEEVPEFIQAALENVQSSIHQLKKSDMMKPDEAQSIIRKVLSLFKQDDQQQQQQQEQNQQQQQDDRKDGQDKEDKEQQKKEEQQQDQQQQQASAKEKKRQQQEDIKDKKEMDQYFDKMREKRQEELDKRRYPKQRKAYTPVDKDW